MNLLPRSLLQRFEDVGEQNIPNPIVVARYYQTTLGLEWFATEYHPDIKCFKGTTTIDDDVQYFSLDELELDGDSAILDVYWEECRLSEV